MQSNTLYNNDRSNSPLRTYSPKRGNGETFDRPTYNVTQVMAPATYTSAVATSCAAQPTEKERMIA